MTLTRTKYKIFKYMTRTRKYSNQTTNDKYRDHSKYNDQREKLVAG